jgi:hypothetical protein
MHTRNGWFYGLVCALSSIVLAVSVGSFAAGCGEDEEGAANGDGNGANGDVHAIQIVGQAGLVPGSTGEVPKEVSVGTPVVLAAVALDDKNNPLPADKAGDFYTNIRWESSDASVATVTSQGSAAALVTPLKPGQVTITASYKQVKGSVTITVK